MVKKMTTIQRLRDQGFNRCVQDRFSKEVRVGCSHCQALVINGVATHEHGCPAQAMAAIRPEED